MSNKHRPGRRIEAEELLRGAFGIERHETGRNAWLDDPDSAAASARIHATLLAATPAERERGARG